MGFGITAVCTMQAYSYRLTFYDAPTVIPYWTTFVQGANCSLALDTFTGDALDQIEFFNVTNPGQKDFEPISCNISTALACTTNYFTFNGYPYEQQLWDLVARNSSGQYQAVNWTYFIMAPVPSQPLAPTVINSGTQLQYTTSMYSSEYGAPLIGCLTAAGQPTGTGFGGAPIWTPPANYFPSTLSSNNVPANSTASFASAQNANITVNLADMNLKPNTTYDFWVMCYNSNGRSANSVQFAQTTNSSLPQPKNSAAGMHGSVLASGVMAVMMALAALAAMC